jgi:hypothetical protein
LTLGPDQRAQHEGGKQADDRIEKGIELEGLDEAHAPAPGTAARFRLPRPASYSGQDVTVQ